MNTERIEQLKEECLRKDGKPRKNCDRELLIELVTLQAELPEGPELEEAPDNIDKLKAEYDKLVNRIFDRDAEDGPELKPGVSAKQLARFSVLKDMIRQPTPRVQRISATTLADGSVEVKVDPGPPVNLEGKNDKGWKVLARIMPVGGKIKATGYTAFRITRGTDKPPHVAAPVYNPNPNRNKKAEKKKIYDI
jgi:hypothetical protein